MSNEINMAVADSVIVMTLVTLLSMMVVCGITYLVKRRPNKLNIEIDFTYIPAHHAMKLSYVSTVFHHAYRQGMPYELILFILETEGDRGYRCNALLKYVRCTVQEVNDCVDMSSLYGRYITITETCKDIE